MGNEKERIILRDHVSRQLIMSLSLPEVRKNLPDEYIVHSEVHSNFNRIKIMFDSEYISLEIFS